MWIAIRTNNYVPLAAVISDITHELGSTDVVTVFAFSCVNTIAIIVFFIKVCIVSYSGPLYCA